MGCEKKSRSSTKAFWPNGSPLARSVAMSKVTTTSSLAPKTSSPSSGSSPTKEAIAGGSAMPKSPRSITGASSVAL